MTPVAIPWTESSLKLVARADALVKQTRSLIVVNRSRLNKWWEVSGSSDDDADGTLLKSALERLHREVLAPAPARVWAGKGTGQTCAVCAQTINPDEVENEIAINDWRCRGHCLGAPGSLNVWRRATRALKSECPSSEAGSSNNHPA